MEKTRDAVPDVLGLSSLTKASVAPPLLGCVGFTVGKSVEDVGPVIYAFGGLELSRAIAKAVSTPLPPT